MVPSSASWKQRTAAIIIVLAGMFWITFGLAELFSGPEAADGVIEGLTLGGLILLTLIVAYRRPGFGGSLLVIEGLVPLVSTIIWSRSPIVFLILGLPPLVSGLLFLAQWDENRRSHHYNWD